MIKVKGSQGFAGISVRTNESHTGISDSGRVRIGNVSPAFPLMRPLVHSRPISVNDTGEVQIGDYRIADTSGSTADEANIRIAAVRRG